MNVLVTLNTLELGSSLGPNFNLTADVGSVTPSSATKSELLSGIFVDVDPSATQITITSVGVCTNSLVLTISGQTTTTTTSAVASFVLGRDGANFFTACTKYTTEPITYYAITGAILQIGTILYFDQTLTTHVVAGYYSDGTNWYQCNLDGEIIANGSCATTTTTSTSTTSTSTTSTTTTEAPTTTTTSTTAPPESFNLGFDASTGWQSCYASQSVYYAFTGETLQNGLGLYTDITLSTKAPMGYYSNGANYWYIPPACVEYTFTNNTGFDDYVDYYDCNGVLQQIYVYDGTTSTAVCVDVIVDLRGMTANNNGAGSCPVSTTGIFQDETPCPTTTTTSTSTTTTSTSTTSTSTSTSTTTAAPTSTTTSTTQPGETSTTTTSTTAAPTSTTTSTSSTTSTTTIPLPPGETSTTTTTTTTVAPTTTTTTAAYYSFGLGVDSISGNGACVDYASAPITYYAATPLANGVVLYQDSALSTLVPDNYYSNGIHSWLITGGNGILTSETLCSGGTTTTTTAAPQCSYDGFTITCDDGTTSTTSTSSTTSTTTEAGTTTTTTAGITYISYPADKYGCDAPNCGAFVEATEIAFPNTFTPVINKWYSPSTPNGYAYQLTSTTPSAGPGLIMYAGTFNTCGLACSI